jgi:sugar O-acyltransferase (sialic acid O-acetyltransferase NeuD family)
VKPPLIIVTASGLAREVSEAVRIAGDRRLAGFVDDDAAQWGKSYAGVDVLGSLEEVASHPDAELVICAGRGRTRQVLEARLLANGVDDGRFATIVHPGVRLPSDAVVGAGSVLLGGCVLTAAVTIGRHVVAMPHVTLTHDDVVDDYATLCAGVNLGGNVRIGARAYLGMSSAVRENSLVGADAVIGMGAAVVRDVPSGQTWVGVPARPVATSS